MSTLAVPSLSPVILSTSIFRDYILLWLHHQQHAPVFTRLYFFHLLIGKVLGSILLHGAFYDLLVTGRVTLNLIFQLMGKLLLFYLFLMGLMIGLNRFRMAKFVSSHCNLSATASVAMFFFLAWSSAITPLPDLFTVTYNVKAHAMPDMNMSKLLQVIVGLMFDLVLSVLVVDDGLTRSYTQMPADRKFILTAILAGTTVLFALYHAMQAMISIPTGPLSPERRKQVDQQVRAFNDRLRLGLHYMHAASIVTVLCRLPLAPQSSLLLSCQLWFLTFIWLLPSIKSLSLDWLAVVPAGVLSLLVVIYPARYNTASAEEPFSLWEDLTTNRSRHHKHLAPLHNANATANAAIKQSMPPLLDEDETEDDIEAIMVPLWTPASSSDRRTPRLEAGGQAGCPAALPPLALAFSAFLWLAAA